MDEEMEQMGDQLEVLQESNEEMKLAIARNQEALDSMQSEFSTKAVEKTLAFYFDKLSSSLQKDCGEKPYQNKLNQKDMLGKFYQSEDSIALAKSIDILADKIQIIGMNLITQKKFKGTAAH